MIKPFSKLEELNVINREALEISDFEFLRAFKDKDEEVYFRLWNEVNSVDKPQNQFCSLENSEYEYLFMQQCFRKYQRKGYGVYFVVNSGGQRKENITRINSYMLDLDFGKIEKKDGNGNIIKDNDKRVIKIERTLEQIEESKRNFLVKLKKFKLSASVIVETKNGFHVYWLTQQEVIEDSQKDEWQNIQNAFVAYFRDTVETEFQEFVDGSVNNFAKLMRIPNYNHLKQPDYPFFVKCIFFNTDITYVKEQICEAVHYDANFVKEKKKGTKSVKKESTVNTEKFSTVIVDTSTLINAIKNIDIRDFLGLNVGLRKTFCCEFHHDKNPSAIIDYKSGYGYRYFCYSSNSSCEASGQLGMDLINIIESKLHYTTAQAIRYIKDRYGVTSDWELVQKSLINKNSVIINEILSDDNTEYKNLKRMLGYAIDYVNGFYDLAKTSINETVTIDNDNLFFMSNRYLAKKIKKKVDKTNQYLNLLCILNLAKKVRHNDIDNKIISRTINIAKSNRMNGICYYSVVSLTKEVLKIAEGRAKLMYQNGFSVKGISRVYVSNLFGEAFANEIYHLRIKEAIDKNEMYDYVSKVILINIQEKGYFTKDMLMALKHYGHDKLEFEYRRNLPSILENYNLVLLKNPSEIRILGINTRKNVIVSMDSINI